ncbi:MAG: type II toxin-antitoxin system RelE/ParE family toxin [Pseudomonadota bacterium]
MSFQVLLTEDASRDLEDLYDYIEFHDVPGKADYVLDQIEKAFSSLSENPERGAYPKELLAIGLREYREIFFKPYRIIYRVMAESVYVMVIAAGRRDMPALLQRRLLQA